MRALILAAMMAALFALPASALAIAGDPNEPPDEPELIDRVCTSRVNVTGATVLGQLTTLIQCPAGSSAAGFNQAKLNMLNVAPKCNQRNDVIRIHYPWAVGVTFTSPELGECIRGGTVVFSRDL
jgi:hypothetical protein